MKLILGKNSTNNLINIFIQDSSASTKTGLTGIDYTKVKAFYYKTGEYHSHQINLTNSNIGIWQSGGFVEIDATGMPGLYQLQLPNIVTADDSSTLLDNSVSVFVKDAGANNVTLVTLEIQLTENSLDDFATVYDTMDANIVSVLGVATDGTFDANITEVNGSSVAVSTSVDANVVAVNGTEVSDVITAGETVPSNVVEINGFSTIDVGQSAELTPYEWYQQVYIELENVREDVLNIDCNEPVTVAAGGITSTSFAGGAIDANALAAGAITAATVADNTIDIATFAADVKTGNALKANVETMSANTITNAAIADTALINANVTHWLGFDAQVGSDGLPDVNTVNTVDANVVSGTLTSVGSVTGSVGSVTGSVGSIAANGIAANSFVAGAIDAAAIADSAIDIATFAADVKTGTYINAQIKASDNIDFGALQKTSLNNATPTSVGSVTGNVVGSVGSIAANGITATSIADNAEINANVIHWDGFDVQVSSDGLPEVNTVNTVNANVVGGTIDSVTTVTGNVLGSVASVAGNVTGSVGSVAGNVTGSVGSIAAGGIDANTFAFGAITAATIADSAIDIATFAADVKTGAALKANVETMSANTITNDAIAADAEINANVMHWAGFDAQATSSGLPDVNTVNVEEIVETLLKYDFSSISGESSRCVLNSLRKLMNKISLSAVALTVYKEDDVTVAYTQTATTDPAGIDPVVGLDTN